MSSFGLRDFQPHKERAREMAEARASRVRHGLVMASHERQISRLVDVIILRTLAGESTRFWRHQLNVAREAYRTRFELYRDR
jgi:hypothetical protein